MKNLINGGYKGEIHPINPGGGEIMGKKAYKSVKDVPGEIDVAVFAIPAKFVAAALTEVGEKKIPGAVLIPSGFAETGNMAGQQELVAIARKYDVRLMGPNIYGFYYTWKNLCATFCTAVRRQGPRGALVAVGRHRHGDHRLLALGEDGGVGDRGTRQQVRHRRGRSAHLLRAGRQHDRSSPMHCEDLKDGRAFAEVAKRVSKKKPVVMLKAGRTSLGARAASSHTGALAGNDRIYEDVLTADRRHSRAEPARPARLRARHSGAAHAEGRERRHHHRRRRLGRAALGCRASTTS